ncbi:MAG: GTPase domain-containing protein [Planctomycetes bacterium]|nr:GTPase domain-containing protein [Planctomycetota bacterium]
MNRLKRHWRLLVVGGLFVAPIVALICFGSYYLWISGLAFWLWWPLTGSLVLAVYLGWRWQKQRQLLRNDFAPPLHWTERDRQAWHIVEDRATQAAQLKAEQMTSLPFYVESGQALALDIAKFYHPNADDPMANLTLPEILAVIELAARDLAEMVDQYLPGGHLLTLNDMRRLKQLADWYPTVSNVSWLISSIFSPVETAVRYLASQAGMNKPWRMLQENVLVWFYTAFLHRLGSYLIDLNSGRLRVGAQRYRELQAANTGGAAESQDPADAVRAVTFVLAGQAKTGKSSLINSLLGEQRAFADVLPATAEIESYELQSPGVTSRFRLLDTVGYGNKGPREDQKRATEEAARQADVIILVLHARNPARLGDADLMQDLRHYFKQHRDLIVPPVLAVVTHVDLLSPALEWAPPSDWQNPRRPKEREIHDAVAAVQEQLGSYLAGVIPVCTAPGKLYGIQEFLLPALVSMLDQAHAVAFLRCLKAEIDMGKIRKVFRQLAAAGKGLVKTLLTGG